MTLDVVHVILADAESACMGTGGPSVITTVLAAGWGAAINTLGAVTNVFLAGIPRIVTHSVPGPVVLATTT